MSDDSPFHRSSRIDRAIDRAVRDMVRRDPPAGLRRRVLARIEHSPTTGWIPRVALATAALAAVFVAAAYLRPPPSPSGIPGGEPTTAGVQARTGAESAAPAPPTTADTQGTRRPAPPRGSDTLIAMPPIRNVFASPSEHAAGASVDTWPIALPSEAQPGDVAQDVERPGGLTPAAIRTNSIAITPLAIDQLQIGPLRR